MKAKDAARSVVGLHASPMPDDQLRRNGVEPEEMASIIEAIGAGDMDKGIELTTLEIAERLSIAGTPEECAEKMGEIESVPDVDTQLQLAHDKVMPAFSCRHAPDRRPGWTGCPRGPNVISAR